MDQRMPDFSIIIPVFQNGRGAVQAIQSLLDQTIQTWEALIVDDGSDPPLDLGSLRNIDARIRTFQLKENKGRSFARNLGIENAMGGYVCFLDSDDEYLPNHLESIANHSNFKDQGTILRTRMIRKTREGEKKEICNRISDPLKYFLLHHSGIHTFAIPKEIVERVRFHEKYSQWEDYHFVLQALSIAKFEQLDFYTAIYHANYSSFGDGTFNQLEERIKLQFECIEDLKEKLKETNRLREKDFEIAKSNSLLHYIENMVRQGKFEYAKSLLGFMKGRPLSWKQRTRKLKFLMACSIN